MRHGLPWIISRRRLQRGAIALGIIFALWIMASSLVAYRLTHRPHARFEEPMPKVVWGPLEHHRIKTSDGEELGAWFKDGRPNAPSVLVLHGNRGSRRNSLGRAETFASQGCAVLMISHRAHGDSSGNYHDIGYGASRDVLAAVDFLRLRRPGCPVVLMGTSMGAAAAIFAASELGHRVHGYILESPYQDLKIAAWNRTEVHLPPVLSQIAYLGLRMVGPLFLPHLDDISPVKAIRGIPEDVPVLILAGDSDRLARPEEARALYNKVATHARLILFPGVGHHDMPASVPSLFNPEVLKFCEEVEGSARNGSLTPTPARIE